MVMQFFYSTVRPRKEFLGIDYYYTVSNTTTVGSSTPQTRFNFALGKPTTQSSTFKGSLSSRTTDGNINGHQENATYTSISGQTDPSLSVDLKATINIHEVIIYNRSDDHQGRLSGFKLNIYEGNNLVFNYTYPSRTPDSVTVIKLENVNGNKVEIMLPGNNKILSLAEVEVYGELKATKPTRFRVQSHDRNDGLSVQMLSSTNLEFIGAYREDKKSLLAGVVQ